MEPWVGVALALGGALVAVVTYYERRHATLAERIARIEARLGMKDHYFGDDGKSR